MGEFSTNLARLRTEHDMSQEELAKRVGVTQSAIWQYENGISTPKIAVAISMARVLGTTCEELVGGDNYDETPNTCADNG